jgi:hypothetical protein
MYLLMLWNIGTLKKNYNCCKHHKRTKESLFFPDIQEAITKKHEHLINISTVTVINSMCKDKWEMFKLLIWLEMSWLIFWKTVREKTDFIAPRLYNNWRKGICVCHWIRYCWTSLLLFISWQFRKEVMYCRHFLLIWFLKDSAQPRRSYTLACIKIYAAKRFCHFLSQVLFNSIVQYGG